jgi:hypothetical protein
MSRADIADIESSQGMLLRIPARRWASPPEPHKPPAVIQSGRPADVV